MSSATSTSAVRLKPESKNRGRPNSDGTQATEGFRPWHFFVLASLMLATVAVVMSRRSTPEHLILISFTIGAAGAAAAGFYRMLVPLTSDDEQAFREPLSARSRDALEREKTLALRSIKELEFDRAMRKLSDKDFEEMGGRLRARAMSLMRQLDEGGSGYRLLIEKELKSRLAALPDGDTQPGHSKLSVPIPSAGVFCTACGTPSDPDAAFCKRCGTRLQQEVVQ
jgi:hypothetical protein